MVQIVKNDGTFNNVVQVVRKDGTGCVVRWHRLFTRMVLVVR
jgi:hypothetical protein